MKIAKLVTVISFVTHLAAHAKEVAPTLPVRLLEAHKGSVMCVAYSPDDKMLATSSRDELIHLWDPQTGKLQQTITGHTGDVYCVAFSPSGEFLASCSEDQSVRLWNAKTFEPIRTFEGHTAIVRWLAFSPDGKTLASAGADKTVRLWDVSTGAAKGTLAGHTGMIKMVCFSPDGKTVVTGASDTTIRIWDVATQMEKAVLQGHTTELEAVAISPDGGQLASSSNDSTVRIWDVVAAKLLHTLKAHAGEVDSVGFTPDGRWVISGGKDQMIRIWDAATGNLRRTVTGHTGRVESLTISRDGRTLATGGGGSNDTSVRLWDLAGLLNNDEAAAQTIIGKEWKLSTFEDFSKGTFSDGGANVYVSAAGRVELVNRWDLNHDGFIDLVFANSHPHVEKLDAAIYWGNGKDFDGSRMSYIPNEGAQRTVAADLDKDGQIDAVVPNYTNGTWSKMDSAVYFGGKPQPNAAWSVPPFARKLGLPTEAAQSAAVGDLNKDGYPDIVFALSAGFWEYRGSDKSLASPTRIYWGAKDGYTLENHADIEASGASDVAIEDLNADGWPDLVIANRERAGAFDVGSFVYWGGAAGLATERRIELPTRQANAVAVHDINQDGRPDLLFANGLGTASYIYLNENGNFRPERRLELPTSDARDCAATDLNGDGFADIFFTNHQTAGNFAAHSYLYWGSKDGFAPESRQEFETLGAWGVSLADLNGDKRPEIIVSNFREHVSFDVPSYIFWNSADGLTDTLRTSLFTRGAIGNTVADFNGDGHPDIIFNNTIGRTRGGTDPVFVYWGNAKGEFAKERRLELPGVEAYEWAAGDLNQDGLNDLIVANQAETGRKITENFIYWGRKEGLSETHRSALMAQGGRGVSLADLDHDGFLDVVLFNSKPSALGAFIYWGATDGYVTTQRSQLPGPVSGVPTMADLNSDSHLDLILASGEPGRGTFIYWGNGKREYSHQRRSEVPESKGAGNSEVADLNRDGHLDLILTRRGKDPSYIYHGDGRGEFRRVSQLKPAETQGVTVGDLNRDGWLDIVVPVYSQTGSRATLSRVHMGGPDGIPEQPTIELPTNAGTGSQIADYNSDGFNDLLLVCHRSEGDPNRIGAVSDHVTDSYLYWGAADGLRADRKLLIPIRGAHYDSGVDLGNIYDRSMRFDYISPAHHYGRHRPDRIAWNAETLHGAEIQFQVRTAATQEALAAARWMGPQGDGSYYQTSGEIRHSESDHTWMQFRALLNSRNGAGSPALDEVSISFRAPLAQQ